MHRAELRSCLCGQILKPIGSLATDSCTGFISEFRTRDFVGRAHDGGVVYKPEFAGLAKRRCLSWRLSGGSSYISRVVPRKKRFWKMVPVFSFGVTKG